MKQEKTFRYSIEDAIKIVESRQLTPLFTEYKNIHQPLLCETQDIYKYKVVPKLFNLKKSNSAEMFHPSNPYTIENIHKWIKVNNKPYDLLSTEYFGSKEELILFCHKCKQNFSSSWKQMYDEFNEVKCNNKVCKPLKRTNKYECLHVTHPHIGKYLVDFDQGYRYSSGSNFKLEFKCSVCDIVIGEKVIKRVVKHGLYCTNCSDGISIPEKFTYNILKQIGEQFEYQYSPKWAFIYGHKNNKLNGNKIYDFYLPRFNCTIETHGIQHKDGKLGPLTAKEQQENDKLKRKLSEINGNIHIEIEAYKSEFQYLKENVSKALRELNINTNEINWEKAWIESQSTWVKYVCELYNENKIIKDIIHITKLSYTTIRRYLIRGREIGWCDYEIKQRKPRVNKNYRKKKAHSRIVVQLSLNGEYINEFLSISEAGRKAGIHNQRISEACRNADKVVGGFKWMYKDDYQSV